MNCTEVQPALSDVLDGTLHRDRRAQVEAHLESCADCRGVLADVRRIREQARALPKVAPPEALWEKVRAGFEAETASGKHGHLRQGSGGQGGLRHGRRWQCMTLMR